MDGIDVGRWIGGGTAAGAVIWLLEAAGLVEMVAAGLLGGWIYREEGEASGA